MPISWNEIKSRALNFSREWADEASEDAEAKSFWDAFFDVFGVPRRRLATFERKVKKIDGKDGYIDLLWKGVLLIEHKSRGKDLDRAHKQARDYFHGLTDAELPKYLLVSDFARFRLYDLDTDEPPVEFELKEFHKHVRRFGFIAGYQPRAFKEEDAVNIQAAEKMGKLHDALKAAGYDGHQLEVLLVRLLFCLFGDDTGIFARHSFHELIAQRTSLDGSDLGLWLGQLFQTLNTDTGKRQSTLDAQLSEFPYVNGKLFEEQLSLAAFDAKMRELLLDASALDWSRISPAIFGSMFQSVMDAKARRNLGAHYTSEMNILKLIGPLFLDELKAELDAIGTHAAKLKAFHNKLAKLKFMDPACGCGNFLVIAYRELRLVEIEVLSRLYANQASVLTNVADHVAVDVDQFYGIEIEEFPAQIAQVALWLMDHQMNLRVAEMFGEYFVRLPLIKSATIIHDDALVVEWNSVCPSSEVTFLLGNPPFIGSKLMDSKQRANMARVAGNLKGYGVLDFVAAWYLKATQYIGNNPVTCAFVSTSSITQGEQVGILWGEMLRKGFHISFAHRTFRWNNEAKGVAAVHCIIVGFTYGNPKSKRLFDYEDVNGTPHEITASNINPYLVDYDDILLANRTKPICDVPELGIGNKPVDGGYFLLSPEEKNSLIKSEPSAEKYIKRWLGADEFLNSHERWCLYLKDVEPSEIRAMPHVYDIVENVRKFRLGQIDAKSGRKSKSGQSSLALADTPTSFHVTNIPISEYLLIPCHSSESRSYIPMGFISKDIMSGNANLINREATKYHFGVMQSTMHMAWVRAVCGRLESRYRYSAGIVYNNFPWPESISDKLRVAIESAAKLVLEAREKYQNSTLSDMYDNVSMPENLRNAHKQLDRAVDAAYRNRPFMSDADRVAFLFARYQALTSVLPPVKSTKPRKPKTN